MATTEEDLREIKAQVLIYLRAKLVENVDPGRYVTHLRSKFVLNERDCDEIKNTRSRAAAAEAFLDILGRKGSLAYDEFCEALLNDGTQIFLLAAMNKVLQVLKQKVAEEKIKAQQQQKRQQYQQQQQQQQRQQQQQQQQQRQQRQRQPQQRAQGQQHHYIYHHSSHSHHHQPNPHPQRYPRTQGGHPHQFNTHHGQHPHPHNPNHLGPHQHYKPPRKARSPDVEDPVLGVDVHAFEGETESEGEIALRSRDSPQVVTDSPLPPDGLKGEDENGVQELPEGDPENSDSIDQVDADLPHGEHGQ